MLSWLANNNLVYGPCELKFYRLDGFRISLHGVLPVCIVPAEGVRHLRYGSSRDRLYNYSFTRENLAAWT